MILSKLITANNLEAIAAPEMKASAMIRKSEAVFRTVDGAKLEGSEYASAMLTERRTGVFYKLNLPLPSLSILQPATPSMERATEVGVGCCGRRAG